MVQTLDPLVSLAFSLRASPGVYGLMLGSGISRAAGIPTGWEVVLDLIRRLAAAQDVSPSDAPDRWYAETFGKEANYSELLDSLCRSQTDRQQLLKGYFEPTEEEREQGLKLPTDAHHAIAELMAAGLVRVVVTTNFDRLLEQALEQRGIVPVVIGSADQAAGMIPLTHQKHCIIKIHGDYLDTRILNTDQELSAYDPAMESLVERVVDEFGLIVCGWSATWDTAMRAVIERATNRRYACFWTSVGEPSQEAKAVISSRRAETVAITSADGFFAGLLARVHGLEEFDRPHPLSVQAAIGAAKRYLADDSQRIRLHDLYRDVLKDAVAAWRGPKFPAHGAVVPSVDTTAERVKAYDAAATTIIGLNATIARWSRGEQDDLLVSAIGEVGKENIHDGSQYTAWASLRGYPATLMLYAAGMASLLADRPPLLSRLLTARTPTINNKKALAVGHLAPPHLIDRAMLFGLFNGQPRHVPMSDWLHDTLRSTFHPLVADDEDYSLLFDTFEYYFALAYLAAGVSNSGWVPVGAWAAYRHDNLSTIIAGLKGSEVRFAGKAFAAACPVLTQNGETIEANIAAVHAFRSKLGFH
ncbi:SIR2 family protein [Sphingomonas sp. PB2P12]|uniref:SIR2 family protein n=1 Tax=Sphingomonas sandaracina TaxID=3096157 RepID=UPI002FC70CEF